MKQDLPHIFHLAKQKDRLAQKILYQKFSPSMFAVAKSYVGNVCDAEDVLVTSFCKVFNKLYDCKSVEAFPFWLRRIVINDSISFIRKNRELFYIDESIENFSENLIQDDDDFPDFDVQELLEKMPLGYRLIFNLYVFENKKHNEIAKILNISEGTSKSQYNKAKKWLLEFFKNQKNEEIIRR